MAALLPLPAQPKPALLIIDMQAFFFRLPERRAGLEHVVANINALIRHFDTRDWPVVHVVTAYQADGTDWDLKMKAAATAELIAGSPEAAILPEIRVAPGHWQLVKTRYSAFFKTGLAEQLQRQQINWVVVVGAYTHYCVNATVFDAYAQDFVPCLIQDAVMSHLSEEAQLMIERMRRNGYFVLPTGEFMRQY